MKPKISHPFEMKLHEFRKRLPPSSVGPASRKWRLVMNLKLSTAAVMLTTAVASPALAMGPHARSEAVRHQQQRAQMYQQRAQIHPYSGFWPGDVAAGKSSAVRSGRPVQSPRRRSVIMVTPITAITSRTAMAAVSPVSPAPPSLARTDCGISASNG